jgi:hypothetical protein
VLTGWAVGGMWVTAVLSVRLVSEHGDGRESIRFRDPAQSDPSKRTFEWVIDAEPLISAMGC